MLLLHPEIVTHNKKRTREFHSHANFGQEMPQRLNGWSYTESCSCFCLCYCNRRIWDDWLAQPRRGCSDVYTDRTELQNTESCWIRTLHILTFFFFLPCTAHCTAFLGHVLSKFGWNNRCHYHSPCCFQQLGESQGRRNQSSMQYVF